MNISIAKNNVKKMSAHWSISQLQGSVGGGASVDGGGE